MEETLKAPEQASPERSPALDLSLIPLAEGWGWHVYRGGIGPVSTRWIVYTNLTDPDRPLCTYRCLICGFETWYSTGLGAHNQGHDRA